jgi:preprotein translocase SecE subunit
VAEDQSTKKKRLVRNPETFRERAIKAAESSDKPTRKRRVSNRVGKVTSPVFSPISSNSRKLFSKQPFKFLALVFHYIGLVLLPRYLRNSWKELKLVTWPNWQESRRLTFAVLAFAVVFGAVIATVDYGLDKVFKTILLK